MSTVRIRSPAPEQGSSMKFWLMIVFLTTSGNVVGKRQIAYNTEVECYTAMEYIRPPEKSLTVQMECVAESDISKKK